MTKRGNGDGSITKLKGRYQVRLSIEGKRRAWYAPTLKEARALLKEKEALRQQGRLLASPSQTVESYLWQWHKLRTQAVSYATATNYAANIRRAVPHIGKLRLEEVRAAHLDAMYAAELARDLSPDSVRQLHRTLRAAFNQALKQELIWRNPTLGATPPKGTSECATPTPEDVAILLRGTADHRLGLLWALLATTGLRSGEAIGLRWQDIDFEAGHLTIYQSPERRTGQGIRFKEPKTARSKRTVLLLPDVLRRLAEARQKQIDAAKETDQFPPALIFTTTVGTPLDVSAVNRQFHKALNRCGLPWLKVHALRHAVTTYLISRGVPPAIAQAILGHASSRMTNEVYTHLVPAHQAVALPILAELLPPLASA
jgi:integrase